MGNKIIVLLLGISVLCGSTTAVANDEESPYTVEDTMFELMSPALNKILKEKYFMYLKWYARRRPTTNNTILEYLEATRRRRVSDTCSMYELVESVLMSIRKQHNPIECYTGRTYNHTRNIESRNELVNILAPFPNTSNTTRKMVPGNCVFVMFYTEQNCISSRMIYLEFHHAFHFFPHIQWVYVDSLKFYTLNADFGITGLPTLMLFHQGKPVRKYNQLVPTAMRLIKFLWQNTDQEPAEEMTGYHSGNFYFPEPREDSDPYLTLAWSFILICLLYYSAHTKSFHKCLAFTKRMWQESGAVGAPHEHND